MFLLLSTLKLWQSLQELSLQLVTLGLPDSGVSPLSLLNNVNCHIRNSRAYSLTLLHKLSQSGLDSLSTVSTSQYLTFGLRESLHSLYFITSHKYVLKRQDTITVFRLCGLKSANKSAFTVVPCKRFFFPWVRIAKYHSENIPKLCLFCLSCVCSPKTQNSFLL